MRKTIVIDEVEYLLGSAGSLVLCCPKCGEEHFRRASNYFGPNGQPDWHKCYACKAQMEPVRIDELYSRWKPFWNIIDSNDYRKEFKTYRHMWE